MSGENILRGELLDVISLRHDLLSCIEGRELEKRELENRVDSSQATVYRGINTLEDAGLVEYGTDGYRLTVGGRILLEGFNQFTTLVEDTIDARRVLNSIPGNPPVAADFIRNSEVISGDNPNPHAPGTRIPTLLSKATRTRGLAKAHTQSDASDVWHRSIVKKGVDTELVFKADFYEYLRSLEDPKVESALSSENLSGYEIEDVPFGLLLIETRDQRTYAALLAYGDEGLLHGLVVNDSREAINWARNVYRRYKERATAVDEQ